MTEPFVFTLDLFDAVVAELHKAGYADSDIEWSENVKTPDNAADFAIEAIWVVCCSGMKYDVARLIQGRAMGAIEAGRPVAEVFGHIGKAAAMDRLWHERDAFYAGYLAAEDRIEYCATLPWIGKITKFHLAKSLGVDCAKPDVHLQRLADLEGCTVTQLCERIAKARGYRIATVDLLIWRACAVGIIDSTSGSFTPVQ